MTRESWLKAHPYLQSIADLQAIVDRALALVQVPAAAIPSFDNYREDFYAGIPLLDSASAAVDVTEASQATERMMTRLAQEPLPVSLAAQCTARDEGLVRYIGSTVLSRHLAAVVSAFGQWRDEDRWLRNHCPTCGGLPAMAQLSGSDPGRQRLLSCGCCRTRWRYRRASCPFCEAQENEHQQRVVAIEGDAAVRIDHCGACRAYIKTYVGDGDEQLMLADWTSLHLDVLAKQRGLERLAASLFELPVITAS